MYSIVENCGVFFGGAVLVLEKKPPFSGGFVVSHGGGMPPVFGRHDGGLRAALAAQLLGGGMPP